MAKQDLTLMSLQTLEELEEPATRAVRAAVRAAHEAGLRTLGTTEDGRLVFTYPNGEVRGYEPRDNG